MMWLYGSGFPKSYNISKGFDRGAFKSWLKTIDHGLRKAEMRNAVSAAVNGQMPIDPRPGRKEEMVVWGMDKDNPKIREQTKSKLSKGSRLLAALLARFWEPLSETERHGVWQEIVGDHEGCDVGMPPGVRLKVGSYQPPNGLEWNLAQAEDPTIPHSVPMFTASGTRTLDICAPSTPLAKEWEGFGSGLKPAWEPVIVARKPLSGTLCENFEKWGTGGLNIDECRIGYAAKDDSRIGKGYAMNPQNEDEMSVFFPSASREHLLLHKPQGRWPANLVLSHSPECRRMGTKRLKGRRDERPLENEGRVDKSQWRFRPTPETSRGYANPDGYEQVEDWLCVESCPVRLLDEQSGISKSSGGINPGKLGQRIYGQYSLDRVGQHGGGLGDIGGASRFFYCAKASRKERTAEGAVENKHPTVKPIALMEYLVRLVTPPGGIVFDPFCGTGSTLIGADRLGFDWLGCDNDPESVAAATKRIEEHHKKGVQLPLKGI